jgi:hypothetical protein
MRDLNSHANPQTTGLTGEEGKKVSGGDRGGEAKIVDDSGRRGEEYNTTFFSGERLKS